MTRSGRPGQGPAARYAGGGSWPCRRPGRGSRRRDGGSSGQAAAGLAPAAAAAGIAVLILAMVASAFVAGRLTRTTPSAPPTTSGPGFLDEGPETGRRNFGWATRDSGLTVELEA